MSINSHLMLWIAFTIFNYTLLKMTLCLYFFYICNVFLLDCSKPESSHPSWWSQANHLICWLFHCRQKDWLKYVLLVFPSQGLLKFIQFQIIENMKKYACTQLRICHTVWCSYDWIYIVTACLQKKKYWEVC